MMVFFTLLGFLAATIVGCSLFVNAKSRKKTVVGAIMLFSFPLAFLSLVYGFPFVVQGNNDLYFEKEEKFHHVPAGIWYQNSLRNYTNGATRVIYKLAPESWNVRVFNNLEQYVLEVGVMGIENELVFADAVGQTNYQANAANMLTGITTDSFYTHRKMLLDAPTRYELDTNGFIADLKLKGITLWNIRGSSWH